MRLRASLPELGLQGEPSRVYKFYTKCSAPDKPQPPRAGKKTSTSVTLMWKKPAENGGPITNYVLEGAEQARIRKATLS